eukprot:15364481-Ditylum_brightwellii.AAC.1
MLGSFKAVVATKSITVAQAAECEPTIREKGNNLMLDSNRRVGVTVLYDTHWQMHSNGHSHNSSSDAGYTIGFKNTIVAKKARVAAPSQ